MKRKKKTLWLFFISIQQERGTRERGHPPRNDQKPKKNGKNERNLKKNLEESFAKASALASPHTRASAKNGRTRKTRTGDRFVGFCCL